jgi:hypothetical protein
MHEKHALSSRPTIISVHVPKTGGTSLLVEIQRGVFGRYLLDYEDRPNSMRVRHRIHRTASMAGVRLRPGKMLTYGIIHGHFRVSKYAFLYPRAIFITFLREPVARIISAYAYLKHVLSKDPEAYRYNPYLELICNRQMDLVEYARLEVFRHLYDRLVGGLSLDKYAFIGITEEYSRSVLLLAKLLSVDINVRHELRNPQDDYLAEYGRFMPELVSANRENTAIYQQALRILNKLAC